VLDEYSVRGLWLLNDYFSLPRQPQRLETKESIQLILSMVYGMLILSGTFGFVSSVVI
jgi:hypothetical protein